MSSHSRVEQINCGLTIACITKLDLDVVLIQFSEGGHLNRFMQRRIIAFDIPEQTFHVIEVVATGDLISEMSEAHCAPECAIRHVYVDNETLSLHIINRGLMRIDIYLPEPYG